MTTLLLVRHAATAWTQERRLQGRTDIDLSDQMMATVLLITVPADLDAFLHRFHAASGPAERDAVSRAHGITFLPET